jgi:hypothetical protein
VSGSSEENVNARGERSTRESKPRLNVA